MILPLACGKRSNFLSQWPGMLRLGLVLADCLLRTESLVLLTAMFCLSSTGEVWLGLRSVVTHRALPAWLSFRLAGSLALLLVPGLPAIGDIRQQGPDFLNVLLRPRPHVPVANSLSLWCWHFLGFYVSVETGNGDSQFLSGLLCREVRHLRESTR